MRHIKLWLTTVAVLLFSVTRMSGEIILTEADGLLETTSANSAGVLQYVYTSPTLTLNEATNTLVFTFLETHTTTNSLNDKNGYPFVALAEFFLYDGDGNRISLDTNNFSTNAQEPKEGPLKNICDNNFTTFFHSMWSTGASDYHNITVTLPEGMELKEFKFKYYTRYTSQCVPKKIHIDTNHELFSKGTCGDNLTWKLAKDGNLVISGSGAMRNYDNNYNRSPWYDYRQVIKNVTINEGITTIGDYAFFSCEGFTKVEIPEGVERVGYRAFCNCYGLQSIYIPQTVSSIGEYAFAYCDNLTTIVVDEENPKYDSRNNCNAIIETSTNTIIRGTANTARVKLENVKSIGNMAFSGCNALSSYSIPEGVASIGEFAFSQCYGLASVLIPQSVNTINEKAFFGCNALAEIKIYAVVPPAIQGSEVFKGVNINNCVLSVPAGSKEAYQAADGWKEFSLIAENTEAPGEIILSQGNEPLGTFQQNAYGRYYYYTSPMLTLDKATSTIVLTFLEGYSETASINDKNGFPFVALSEFYLYDGNGNEIALNASNFSTNAQEPKEGPIRNICDKNYSTHFHSMWSTGASDYHNIVITLPEGLELKDFSFEYYTRQSSRHGIPKKISVKAGTGNEVIANGTCGDNLTWKLTSDGTLNVSGSGDMYDYNADFMAPWYSYRNLIQEVTINEGVTTIGSESFYFLTYASMLPQRCPNLNAVSIPNSVKRIGRNAFYDTGLTSIYIPKSVVEIQNAAFGGCQHLRLIEVDAENPIYDSREGCNAVIDTERNALISGCITTIIPEGIEIIADSAFVNCDSLSSIELPESVQRIEHRAFWDCDNLESITISQSVDFIAQQAFGYCRNLATISVDAANAYFDSRNNCNAIIETSTNTIVRGTANTIIPESVKAIGDFAFSGCLPMKSFNIPEGVTSIGNYAFCQCNNLTSVTIPQSVNTIGEYAFYYCYNLSSPVEIPEGVTVIRDWSFAQCKIPAISFPQSLTVIGGSAFYECPNLETITLGKNVQTIEEYAFFRCSALSQINSLAMTPPQILGTHTFYKVDASTCQLNVPVGSKEAYQAADGWKEFSLITEKKELTSSSEIIIANENGPLGTLQQGTNGTKRYCYTSPVQTFDKATNTLVFTFLEGYSETSEMNDKNGFPFIALTEFYLYDGKGNEIALDASNFSTNAQEPTEGPIKNIYDKNFNTFFHTMWSTGASNYHSVTITLPEGVELKEFSFKYWTRWADKWTCHGIPKKISVKAGYEVISEGSCGDNLAWTLTADGSLTIAGSGEMYDFETEESVPWYEVRNSIKRVVIGDEVTKIGGFAFIYCANLLSVDISESVRSIGYNAFYGTGLLSIFIPANVTEIGVAAFGYCKNMSSMVVDANNPVYDSRNNCNAIIETRSNVLLRGCNTTVIPDGILVIDVDGLSGCMGLTSISIPQSVRSIFDYAFFDCEGLRTIEIPDGVNVIGFRAFWDCDNLTSVTISKSVWHIDQQAFGYCYNLGRISVDSGNLDYDSRDNCNAIIDSHTNTIIRGTANTIIPESVKAIGDFAFSGCLPMKSFNIPECVTSIGSYAFCQCNNLVSVNIPQSVSAIGEYAFYNCYNLTSSIEIPESVAKVNDWTFAYCNKLSAISFPEELISIGNYAFFFCSSLKSAIIPNCVETVGERAFMNCYNLESLSISEGLDTISDYAFSRSDKLKKIVVPKRVSHIGEGAFYGCPILETVTIGKNVQTIGGNAFNQCLSLSQIDSYAVIPPKIVGVGTFYKVNPATCKLNVPVGSKAAYQADDAWKAFKLISEKEGLTSIEQLEASSTSLWPTNIYDMNGRLVRENAHSADGLTGGVYIINGRKVIIRD